MHRFQRAPLVLAVAAATVAAACSDPLTVENRNNPDRNSVLNLARDVEALSGRLYQNVHTAGLNSNTAVYPTLMVLALENASSLNNFGMGPRGGMPRLFIDNQPGNSFITENNRDFQQGQNAARTAATVFERLNSPGFSVGSAGGDARLRAFTWFGYGVALGNVALVYDSASIPRPGDGQNTPPLVGYPEVMAAAIAALDSAQAIATSTTVTMSSITGAWLAQSADVPRADFARLVRSYKARFRAGVARTPAERNAVNWAAVIADATAGIDRDFLLQLNPSGGWDYAWLVQHYATGSANWHQMTPYIIGMADSSGAYDAWLATPRDSRSGFLIRTRDRRFPAGDDRPTQITNSVTSSTNIAPPDSFTFFRNRAAGEDQPGAPWAVSSYDFNRWRALFVAQRIGAWPTFTKVENDMLAAEGYLRTGNLAAALPLIDRTRTENNLPPLQGAVTSLTAPVPGGQSCVPRVPDPARGYTATKCGDAFEAMKWEKRMETAYAGYGVWFFDSRGWGDLPEGTPLQFPTPTQELDARLKPSYNLGGVGRPGGAPRSTTYSFGSGNL
jgi:hypothetical protein